MPGWIRLVGIAGVTLMLQVVVFSRWSVLGEIPNIVLLFVLANSMETDGPRGATAGFLIGAVFDLMLDTPMGLSALQMTVAGWLVGQLHATVMRSSPLISAAIIGVGSFVGTVLYAVVGMILGVTTGTVELAAIVAAITVVNAVFSVPMIKAIGWAHRPDGGRSGRGYFVDVGSRR